MGGRPAGEREGEHDPVLCRRAAGHVDKILRGAQAGDLPVEEALTLEVVINFKATNALGLAIPASLRQRAEIVDR